MRNSTGRISLKGCVLPPFRIYANPNRQLHRLNSWELTCMRSLRSLVASEETKRQKKEIYCILPIHRVCIVTMSMQYVHHYVAALLEAASQPNRRLTPKPSKSRRTVTSILDDGCYFECAAMEKEGRSSIVSTRSAAREQANPTGSSFGTAIFMSVELFCSATARTIAVGTMAWNERCLARPLSVSEYTDTYHDLDKRIRHEVKPRELGHVER